MITITAIAVPKVGRDPITHKVKVWFPIEDRKPYLSPLQEVNKRLKGWDIMVVDPSSVSVSYIIE